MDISSFSGVNLINRLFKKTCKQHGCKCRKGRSLKVEHLEQRQLLSIGGPLKVMGLEVENTLGSTHSPYNFSAASDGDDQLHTVPIGGGVNKFEITFDRSDISASVDDLVVYYRDDPDTVYTPTSFSTTGATATWQFSTAFEDGEMVVRLSDSINSDGVGLDGEWENPKYFGDEVGNSTFTDGSGDGVVGGDFVFHFTLLPGDINQSGRADDLDASIYAVNYGSGPGASWAIGDVTGDGYVNESDLSEISAHWLDPYWQDTRTESDMLESMLDTYESVLNTVEFEPYRGAMKGPEATLETKGGNAWDTASALASLLAEEGFETRYATGRIDMPLNTEAENWQGIEDYLGVVTPEAAYLVLDQAGLSPAWITENSENVGITFDHAWLQVEWPMESGTWVDLDASWKFQSHQAEARNMLEEVSFNESGEDGYLTETRLELADEFYANQVRDYLAENDPTVGVTDLAYRGPILVQTVNTLPTVLPYTTSTPTTSTTFATNDTHRVRVTLLDSSENTEFTMTFAMPEITSDTLAVRRSATGYIELLRSGEVAATSGDTFAVGDSITIVVEHLNADGDDTVDRTYEYTRKAGYYHVIALDANHISDAAIREQQRFLNDATIAYENDSGVYDVDTHIGGLLQLAGLKYFYGTNAGENAICDMTSGISVRGRVASGLLSSTTSLQSSSDAINKLVYQVLPTEMILDVKNGAINTMSIDTEDTQNPATYDSARSRIIGHMASASEHAVWEELTNIEGFSTIKSLQVANEDVNNSILVFDASAFSEGSATAGEIEEGYSDGDLAFEASGAEYNVTGSTLKRYNVSSTSLGTIDDLVYVHATASGDGFIMYSTTSVHVRFAGLDAPNVSNSDYFIAVQYDEVADKWYYDNDTQLVEFTPVATDLLVASVNFSTQDVFALDLLNHDSWIENSVWTSAVTNGYTVTIPKEETAIGASFSGVGWIRELNGAFGYIITGNLASETLGVTNGGITTGTPEDDVVTIETVECSTQTYAYCTTDVADGNLWDYDVDFSLPLYSANGTFSMARSFNGRSAMKGMASRGMGSGWSYSYSDKIADSTDPSDPAGTKIWHTSRGEQVKFFKGSTVGDITYYDLPGAMSGSFVYDDSTDEYTWTDQDGSQTIFDDAGKLTDVVDRYGNGVTVTYDGTWGVIDRVTDAQNVSRYVEFEFDTATHTLIESITDWGGRTWTYSYNGDGLLESVTAPSDASTPEAVTTYEYYTDTTRNGLLRCVTDPNGNTTIYTYYANGRGFETINAAGSVRTMSYNLFRNETASTCPRGNTTLYTYNDEGNVVRQQNADGAVTTKTWHNSRIIATADAFGQVETYRYDNDGNLVCNESKDSTVSIYDYTTYGNVDWVREIVRPETAEIIDLDQLTITEYAQTSTGTYTLEDNGTTLHLEGATNSWKVELADSYTVTSNTILEFDFLCTDATKVNLIGVDYDNSFSSTWMVDLCGTSSFGVNDFDDYQASAPKWAHYAIPVSSFYPTYYGDIDYLCFLGWSGIDSYYSNIRLYEADEINSINYTYQTDGSLISVTDPLNQEITFTYSATGNRGLPETMTTPRGNETATPTDDYQTSYTYNDLGQVETVTTWVSATESVTEEYDYDSLGNLVIYTDALDNETTYTYDKLGRVLTETLPDPDYVDAQNPGDLLAPTITYEYAAAGNVLSITDTTERTTSYEYSRTGKLVKTIFPDSTTQAYSYDASGNLITETDQLGQVTEYLVDNRGRVAATFLPDGTTTQTGYNAAGLPVWSLDQLGRETIYTYDIMGRILETVLPSSIEYVGSTNIVYADDEVTGTGYFMYSEEDIHLRFADEEYPPYETNSNHFIAVVYISGQWYYDDNDMDYNNVRYREFTPEPTDRLVAVVDFTNDTAESLEGVREYEHGILKGYAEGELTIVPNYAGTSVDNGDFTLEFNDGYFVNYGATYTNVYDTAGNLQYTIDPLGNTTEYEYDALGRLTKTIEADPDGSGALTSPETEYDYDADGNLTSVIDARDNTTWYQYDGLGRRTHVTDATGSYAGDPDYTVVTEYDANGNVQYITDQYGETTEYVYDHLGRVVQVIQPDFANMSGLVEPITYYGYDDDGNLAWVTDPRADDPEEVGYTTWYQYDTMNRRTHVTDAMGTEVGDEDHTTVTAYDVLGRVTSVTDQLDRVTSYTYDTMGRVIRTVLPATGDQVDVTPINSGIAAQDAATGTGYIMYSEESVFDRFSTNAPFANNSNHFIAVKYIDGEWCYDNNTSYFAFEPRPTDRLIAAVDFDNDTITGLGGVNEIENGIFKGYAAGDLTFQADRWSGSYNDGEFTVGGTYFVNHGATYFTSYDAVGNVLTETDALGQVTSYAYDHLDRLVAETVPEDVEEITVGTTNVVYAFDNAQGTGYIMYIEGSVHTDDRFTTYPVYASNCDHFIAVKFIDGQWYYDDNYSYREFTPLETDRLVAEVDFSQNLARSLEGVNEFEHGILKGFADGTLTITPEFDGVATNPGEFTLTFADGTFTNHAPTTLYTYDDAGNMLTLTDPELNTTTWVYDDLNRRIEEINQQGDSRLAEFDAMGNLIERTGFDDRVTEYDYDAMNRLVEERWIDVMLQTIHTIEWEYDEGGRLVEVSDPDVTYTYDYNEIGAIEITTHELAALTPTIEILDEYNAAGRRIERWTQIGSTLDYRNYYGYDGNGQMSWMRQTEFTIGNPVADKRVSFVYNEAGQIESVLRTYGWSTTIAETNYTYDPSGRLIDMEHLDPDETTLADYEWTFDAAGRIVQFTSLDGTTDYTYDATGQLTDADHDYQTDETYTYDDNGNRVTADGSSYTTGTDNRLLCDGTYTYEYDEEGNRTLRYVDVDASGTLNTGDTNITEYTWDHRNRLAEVAEYETYAYYAVGGAEQSITYTYDPMNRLIGRAVFVNELPDSRQAFIYDGSQIILQFDDDGAGDIEAADLSHRYLWGPAVDEILADEIVDDGGIEDVLWTLTDHQNTVRDLAVYDEVLEETNIVNHRTYDSFGNITSETAPAVEHLFAYTGRLWDADTGLQNNLNRWYDPAVGRWLSEDPIGFQAGDENLYRYCDNGPTNAIDPNGTDPVVGRDEDYLPPVIPPTFIPNPGVIPPGIPPGTTIGGVNVGGVIIGGIPIGSIPIDPTPPTCGPCGRGYLVKPWPGPPTSHPPYSPYEYPWYIPGPIKFPPPATTWPHGQGFQRAPSGYYRPYRPGQPFNPPPAVLPERPYSHGQGFQRVPSGHYHPYRPGQPFNPPPVVLPERPYSQGQNVNPGRYRK